MSIHIHVTEQAADRLRELGYTENTPLRLLYDSEGCGCAVAGVVALHLIAEPAADDLRAEGDHDIYYEKRHEVFFEPRLRLDYRPDRSAFTLTGDGQIYASSLRLQDRRL